MLQQIISIYTHIIIDAGMLITLFFVGLAVLKLRSIR
jgi:hypothetical protein